MIDPDDTILASFGIAKEECPWYRCSGFEKICQFLEFSVNEIVEDKFQNCFEKLFYFALEFDLMVRKDKNSFILGKNGGRIILRQYDQLPDFFLNTFTLNSIPGLFLWLDEVEEKNKILSFLFTQKGVLPIYLAQFLWFCGISEKPSLLLPTSNYYKCRLTDLGVSIYKVYLEKSAVIKPLSDYSNPKYNEAINANKKNNTYIIEKPTKIYNFTILSFIHLFNKTQNMEQKMQGGIGNKQTMNEKERKIWENIPLVVVAAAVVLIGLIALIFFIYNSNKSTSIKGKGIEYNVNGKK